MKVMKYLLPVVVAATFASTAMYAADCSSGNELSSFEQELDEKDWNALYDYINTKRTINLQEKGCNLTISGDVRGEWRHTNERFDGVNQRGHDGPLDDDGTPIGRNEFNVQFNLRFDYVFDRAWAVAHLQFDDTAGINKGPTCLIAPEALHGSGHRCDLTLKKAYLGYNVCCDGCTRFDVELGRRNLYNVFDSEVQFLSRFDGLLLKYDSCWECVGDWYVNLGGFVIDQRVNHFGWVVETGLDNIMDWGFDVKYSFIDWHKSGTNRCLVSNPAGARFRVSQFTFYYHFDPEYLCMPANVFGAVLWNPSADTSEVPVRDGSTAPSGKQNLGWYVGFQVGEVRLEGDWAIKVQYQWVELLAVPDRDMAGIGNGNALDSEVTSTGHGNTNFKGWRLEGLYALTDNLTFDTRIQWSRQIESAYGGPNSYSEFRLEAIYAF